MSAARILVVGDSHIYALRDGLAKAGDAIPGCAFEILRLSAIKNGNPIGDISLEEAAVRAETLGRSDLLVAMLRGNQFNSMGLIRHPEPFDFLMPCADGGLVQEDATLVPLALIRAHFSESLRSGYGRQLLRLAAAAAASRMVCIAPPAPKEDAEHIKRHAETFFRQHGIIDIGVTAPAIRLKLWLLQHEALSAFCAEHGMICLGNPPQARGLDGYLKRAYYAEDATHGNADYGRLVLEQLAALAGERR